jgi:serine/threonine-protein kinase RsbW
VSELTRSGGDAPGARVVEYEIPSEISRIEGVVEAVRRECAAMRVAEQHLAFNVPVALTEAMANAILSGNRDDPAKHVRVRAAMDELRIVIEVCDEGAGFDLERCSVDPTTPDRLHLEGGRGLFLMHALMDHVEQFEVMRGSGVRMTLHRA